MIKKSILLVLLSTFLNGCSVASAYTGFLMGGEDLANTIHRKYDGPAKTALEIAGFLGGTISGPFVALFWGVQGDAHIVANIDSLGDGYLDIPNDNFILAQYPFSGWSKIEKK